MGIRLGIHRVKGQDYREIVRAVYQKVWLKATSDVGNNCMDVETDGVLLGVDACPEEGVCEGLCKARNKFFNQDEWVWEDIHPENTLMYSSYSDMMDEDVYDEEWWRSEDGQKAAGRLIHYMNKRFKHIDNAEYAYTYETSKLRWAGLYGSYYNNKFWELLTDTSIGVYATQRVANNVLDIGIAADKMFFNDKVMFKQDANNLRNMYLGAEVKFNVVDFQGSSPFPNQLEQLVRMVKVRGALPLPVGRHNPVNTKISNRFYISLGVEVLTAEFMPGSRPTDAALFCDESISDDLTEGEGFDALPTKFNVSTCNASIDSFNHFVSYNLNVVPAEEEVALLSFTRRCEVGPSNDMYVSIFNKTETDSGTRECIHSQSVSCPSDTVAENVTVVSEELAPGDYKVVVFDVGDEEEGSTLYDVGLDCPNNTAPARHFIRRA